MFDFLTQLFGFQRDSVRNQRYGRIQCGVSCVWVTSRCEWRVLHIGGLRCVTLAWG